MVRDGDDGGGGRDGARDEERTEDLCKVVHGPKERLHGRVEGVRPRQVPVVEQAQEEHAEARREELHRGRGGREGERARGTLIRDRAVQPVS